MAAINGGGGPAIPYAHTGANTEIDYSLYEKDDGVASSPIDYSRFTAGSVDDCDPDIQWLASDALGPPSPASASREPVPTATAAAAPGAPALLTRESLPAPAPREKPKPNFFTIISRRPVSIDEEGKLYKLMIDGIEYHLERLGQGQFNEVFRFLDQRPLKIQGVTIPDLSQCVIKMPLEIPKAPSEASGQLNDTIKGYKILADDKSLGCSAPTFYWIPSGAYTIEVSYNISDLTKGRFFITEYIPDASTPLLKEWETGEEGYEDLSPRAKKVWDLLQHYSTRASVNAYPLGDLKPDNIRFRRGKNEPVIVDFIVDQGTLFEDLSHWYVGNEKFLHYVTQGITDKQLKEEIRANVRTTFFHSELIKKNKAELEAEAKKIADQVQEAQGDDGDAPVRARPLKKMAIPSCPPTPRKGLMPGRLAFAAAAAAAPAAPSDLGASDPFASPPRRKMTGSRGLPATPIRPLNFG